MSMAQYPDLIPSYEHERLAALQPYRVLGTPGQEVFNDFVGVVAKLFEVPIALVSLVREDDVVFIGNEGWCGGARMGNLWERCGQLFARRRC